ncbi:MAG: P1 family peptidase [Actinomycetota bacterium]
MLQPIAPTDDAPFGSISDVPGLGVGHHRRIGRGWQTGTTVVVCEGGATPGVDVRGGAPGTRETDALAPERLVTTINAVCLSGGSAFGLAAAEGVVGELESRSLGFPIGDDVVVPVVPSAVIFDLGRGGNAGNRPDATFGARATAAAFSRRSRTMWGSVGAGTGARSGGLQGGVGTASTRVSVTIGDAATPSRLPEARQAKPPTLEFHVGAVAVVNSHGSVIDPATGLPWIRPGRGWRRPDAPARRRLAAARADVGAGPMNTTIGVVATDAELHKAESGGLATVAHDGLARAIRPAHAVVDGDTVFSLATGTAPIPDVARVPALLALAAAAADTFAAACTHAVIAATTIGDAPSWRDATR